MEEKVTLVDSDYSADELGQYQSISTLSVVALVLGLLSPLVLISPLLMLFPFAAASAAVLALAKIRAAGGNLSGANLARLGLALAVIFCVASLARTKISDLLYQRQIDALVQPWLTMLTTDRYEEALELMSPTAVAKLRLKSSALSEIWFFRQRLTAQQLAQDPALQSLAQMARPKKFPELVEAAFNQLDTQVDIRSQTKQANCIYEVTNNRGERLVFSLRLIWLPQAARAPGWRIDEWLLVQPEMLVSQRR